MGTGEPGGNRGTEGNGSLYTELLFYKDVFPQRHSPQRNMYNKMLLHTGSPTQKGLYTDVFTQTSSHKDTSLHGEAFVTQRSL